VNKQAKLQFIKDGVFREDDMTETLNGLFDKLDLYDNNETDNDEGDDDNWDFNVMYIRCIFQYWEL